MFKLDIVYLGRAFAAFGALANIIFVIWIVYRKNKRYDPKKFIYLTIASLTGLSFNICGMIRPYTWFANVGENFSLFMGAAFVYFALNKVYETYEEPRNIWKTKLMLTAITTVVVVSLINYFQQDNILDFGDDNPFYVSWKFTISNITLYLSLGGICYNIVVLCKDSLKKKKQSTDLLVRKFLCMSSFSFAVFLCSIMVADIILLSLGIDTYLSSINKMYQYSRAIMFVLVILGVGAPPIILLPVIYPIDWFNNYKRRREIELLRYLHHIMISIVPRVHLKPIELNRTRLYIEIGDARQIILSHYVEKGSLSALEEAELLCRLFADRIVLHKPGKYMPVLSNTHINKYNISVAIYMQKKMRFRLEYDRTS